MRSGLFVPAFAVYLDAEYLPLLSGTLGAVESALAWVFVAAILLYRRKGDRHLGAVEATFVPGTQRYEIRVMVAEGDHVLAETQLTARAPDGREYRNFYCFVFEMNEGRICEIREHVDTIYAASFFGST